MHFIASFKGIRVHHFKGHQSTPLELAPAIPMGCFWVLCFFARVSYPVLVLSEFGMS